MLYYYFDDDLREKKYKNPTNNVPPSMFPNVTGAKLLMKNDDQVNPSIITPLLAVKTGSIP